MKNFYLLIALILSTSVYSQVGIGTDTPTETLDINGTLRIRDINLLPGTAVSAKDSIMVFDQDGVVKYVSANMIVNNADPSSFANNEKFTSGTTLPTITGTENIGDTYLNTFNNSWWYFDGTSWLELNSGTDDQQLTLVGNILKLEDGGLVDLLPFLDNTDNQNIDGSGFATGTSTLTIGIEDGNNQDVDLSDLEESADIAAVQADVDQNEADADTAIAAVQADVDQNEADADTAIAANTTLINNHVAADLDTDPTNELSDLNLSGNTLTLTNPATGTNSVDLTGFVSTDNQNIDGSGFATGTSTLTIGIEDGNNQDVDLSDLEESADIAAVQADVDQNEADADTAIAAVQADVDQNEADADAAIAANTTLINNHVAADLDTDPTNEIELPTGGTSGQVLITDGSGNYSWATDNVDDADNNSTNEIQTITSPDNSITVTPVGNNYEITLPTSTTPSITLTKEIIGYTFASAFTNGDGTNLFNINSTVTKTSVGNYTITFPTAHPNGANYDITLGADEGTSRDGVIAQVVEGSRTATGFNVMLLTGDNGAAADYYVDSPWSFQVSDTKEVITNITGTNITIN